MPDIRVQDEKGNIHVFPEGSTPEMIARVMNVKPPDPNAGLSEVAQPNVNMQTSALGNVVPSGKFAGGFAKEAVKGTVNPQFMGQGGQMKPLNPEDEQQALEDSKAGYFNFNPSLSNFANNISGSASQIMQAVKQQAQTPEGKGALAADVAMAAAGGIQGLKKALPSAGRAGQALADVKATAGNVAIDLTKPGNTALELYAQSQRGATLPKAVRDFVNRATKPDSPPLTYSEAKDFQSNLSRLSADEMSRLNPNTKRLVGQLNNDLKNSLQNAADVAGKGQQFANAMTEYRQAMRLKGFTDKTIDLAIKAAIGGAAAGTAGTVGYKLVKSMF